MVSDDPLFRLSVRSHDEVEQASLGQVYKPSIIRMKFELQPSGSATSRADTNLVTKTPSRHGSLIALLHLSLVEVGFANMGSYVQSGLASSRLILS